MDASEPKNRRHFTDAARVAALAARRQKTENALPVDTPAVFVVRHEDGRFGWEIRRYGAVLLRRGAETYETAVLARAAGELALSDA